MGTESGSTGHPDQALKLGPGEQSCPDAPGRIPAVCLGMLALTCAAARTFWFKLLPWRGSGGPENTARHEVVRPGG